MTVSPMKASRMKGALSFPAVIAVLLCALVILSFFFPFSRGIHAKEDTPLTFSGVDFLLGRPEGKSQGIPNPMLALSLFAAALAIGMHLLRRGKPGMRILMTAIALCALLMFWFDLLYNAKAEFQLDAKQVAMQPAWMLACGAAALATLLGIFDASNAAMEKRRAEAQAIYANSALPAGYRPLTTRQIIARDFQKHWPVYLLILPTLIYYIVWCYAPIGGIAIAFNDYSAKKGIFGSNWVGLRWFREFFRGPFAYRTIRNTLLISGLNLLVGFPAPILLALMLNEMRAIRYKRVVQTITYMPYFVSLVVLCGILKDFSATDGLFGEIQKLMGLDPVNLLGDAKYFRGMYVFSDLWQRLGWDSIIFLSALSTIDQELYEAATIDGANKLKQVWHITLPGIMPTIAILLVLRIGSMMSLGHEKIILLYNGLTYETADVISSYVYRMGIVEAKFSFSTAVNLFNSIINFLLVVFANKASAALTETSLW